jgi:transcriptional regulator with XRE-family HTH domain
MADDGPGFGARLRKYRVAAGLSQQELAEKSGLTSRTISGLERGRTSAPYRNSLYRLADALELREQARAEFIAAASRRLASVTTGARSGPRKHDAPAPGSGNARVVPRQLPAPVPAFTGRHDQLAALSQVLDEPGGTAVITAIGGTAGVGKTTP